MSLAIPRGDKKPIVWSIAGSDCGAGAGLQADLKTLTALGAHACTIVTSITAQNTGAVMASESVSPSILSSQIEALRDDMPPQAIKIGMLGNAEGVRILAKALSEIKAYTVYDPVMISTSGTQLLNDETMQAMRENLLPHVDLLTPNVAEAKALSGMDIQSDADVERAAEKILKLGVKAVFIKGWDAGKGYSQDYFLNKQAGGIENKENGMPAFAGMTVVSENDALKKRRHTREGGCPMWLTLPRMDDSSIPRGTGCTMASVFAAAHAFGFDQADAAVIAKAYVHRCLRLNNKIGKGPPIADYFLWPVAAEDFPWLTATAEEGWAYAIKSPSPWGGVRGGVDREVDPSPAKTKAYNLREGSEYKPKFLLPLPKGRGEGSQIPAFPDCGSEPLGFYPVVDSVEWLRRILPLAVRTAQLRVKKLVGDELENEIREAVEIAQKFGARLFINDYWQLAIKHGAYGVHLGQEDLATADLGAIAKAGMRLGISTHSYAEAARAKAYNPSYVALGPIFPTTLKSMKFAPQGIETLRIWRQLFACPLVAIGGIKLNQADEIYTAGADSVAVVSDVTQSADPEARVKAWLELTKMRKGSVGKWDGITAFA